jgi:hypothetical protein
MIAEHKLPPSDARAEACRLVLPLVGPQVFLECVTWVLDKQGRQLVRVTRRPGPGDPIGGCIFLVADEVLETFDVLGEDPALLFYEMHFMKHRMT